MAGAKKSAAAFAALALLLLAAVTPFGASAFAPPRAETPRPSAPSSRLAASVSDGGDGRRRRRHPNNGGIEIDAPEEAPTLLPTAAASSSPPSPPSRRAFLSRSALLAGSVAASAGEPALALVKGNAPPPKKEKAEKKCTNVEECQEMAERLAKEQDEELRAAATPPKVAPGGSRYRDVEQGPPPTDGDDESLAVVVAKTGDSVSIRYKVLKLGKRSYDGLSGEGTVVFSRGYGLEDDESRPGEKTFDFKLGDPTIIDALNDAVPGMAVGGTRRISVLPQMGWRKPGRECDGGPGGSGAGGDLKTDYVVVPTATMVAEEVCFDKSKRPFPTAYAQQRRMAQRFDQSLIVEAQLVGIN